MGIRTPVEPKQAERAERGERSETRELILNAARELFAERGYEAVSMRKIAERVDLTPTAIYFHFQDKKALFVELCQRDFLALARDFVEIAAMADPVERLRHVGYAYVDFALAHPNHYRLMFMSPGPEIAIEELPDHIGQPETDGYAFTRGVVAEAIAGGRLHPSHGDVEQVTQLLWAAAHGVVSLYIAKCDHPMVSWGDVRATARSLVDLAIHGLTCREEGR